MRLQFQAHYLRDELTVQYTRTQITGKKALKRHQSISVLIVNLQASFAQLPLRHSLNQGALLRSTIALRILQCSVPELYGNANSILTYRLLRHLTVVTRGLTMNIDRVRVKGLFNDFDHDLAFGSGERIMLVIGPNGFGKTTTLKLINTLFNHAIIGLAGMPFLEITVDFDDGAKLTVNKTPASHLLDTHRLPLELSLRRNGEIETHHHPKVSVSPNEIRLPLGAIEDYLPVLDRVGPLRWRNIDTGEMLDLTSVLIEYWEELPPDVRPEVIPDPDWLQQIKQSIGVRLISTERLTYSNRRWRRSRKVSPRRTVSHYSVLLGNKVQNSLGDYSELSQALDSTFPTRLVENHQRSDTSAEELGADLDAIERKRAQLEDIGLYAGDKPGFKIPNLNDVDVSQRGVLAVYAQDAKKKLAVFDEIYDKVSTFTKIVNSRFRHKQVSVSQEGLTVTRDDGTNLDLERLSSGEQHEIIMLYELLFRASSNSLILIDEPEISLHVAWQEQWLADLEEAAKLSDFRAIVATHSPEIIGDRWDLAIELRG